jgi:hypothetical protein
MRLFQKPPLQCAGFAVSPMQNSGEHMIKKSDLRDVLGKPSQAAPFLFPQARPRREGRW